jgi:Protein of unknown function DUF262
VLGYLEWGTFMEAFPSQIIQFFNGFKQSVIPLFQRPYEWKEPNWETWQDVLERYESSTEASHFMGAIVTMPSRSVPVGVAKHLIIDGQQRLTTLAILLCSIRDELAPDASTERTRIQNYYLTNDGYKEWDYLNLLPTQDDRDGFKALVNALNEPLSLYEMQMHRAYDFFRRKIKAGDSDGDQIDVSKLLGTIERKLIIVSINLGEAEDPYLIFESLNAKGSGTTPCIRPANRNCCAKQRGAEPRPEQETRAGPPRLLEKEMPNARRCEGLRRPQGGAQRQLQAWSLYGRDARSASVAEAHNARSEGLDPRSITTAWHSAVRHCAGVPFVHLKQRHVRSLGAD